MTCLRGKMAAPKQKPAKILRLSNASALAKAGSTFASNLPRDLAETIEASKHQAANGAIVALCLVDGCRAV